MIVIVIVKMIVKMIVKKTGLFALFVIIDQLLTDVRILVIQMGVNTHRYCCSFMTEKILGMSDIQMIDEELRVFIMYCRELPDLFDRKEQAAFDYYNTVGSPRIKSSLEAKYQKSVSPPVERSIELMQRKDDLIAEYEWKASFCRMIQHKLIGLTNEEVDLLYWRYEERLTLRQLGGFYYASKDVMNNRINDILRKMQN